MNNFRQKKILGVCNHPGGANAILPVIGKLKEFGAHCRVLASENSRGLFEKAGIATGVLAARMTGVWARDILAEFSPDLLLLGTSEPEDRSLGRVEGQMAAAAREAGVPAVAVLDHWSNYVDRFSLSENGALDALPDLICVMDERAKSEMVSAGIPSARIVVTGNPHWDRLKAVRAALSGLDKRVIRRRSGLKETDRLIIFVSQPLSEDGSYGAGISEFKVLDDLLELLRLDPALTLWLKPHPREKAQKFHSQLEFFEEKRVRILDDVGDVYMLGLAADLIVGMFSMLLFEYSLLGLPVVSYQPEEGGKYPHLNDSIKRLRGLEELRSALSGLTDRDHFSGELPKATENVLTAISAILTHDKADNMVDL